MSCAESNYCSESTEQVVEMFTWWTQTGEADASRALVEIHEQHRLDARQPTWVNATTMDNNGLARNFLRKIWTEKHRLPDTFQVNIGQDLLKWTDQLEPLDFLLDEEIGLRETFFKPVLEEASNKGVLYGIPLNIHRTNTLFYNRDTVAGLVNSDADIASLEQFERVCEALKARNPCRAPIVLGTKGGAWTLGLLAHEALFPGMWGIAEYRDLWRGATLPQAAASLDRLWAAYQRILSWKDKGWINPDFAEINWTDAAKRLFASDDDDRQAAFFVMGDWVKAEPEMKTHAEKLGRAPFPPAKDVDSVFVYTADSFPLPKSTRNKENATELLRTMMRKDVQLAFSNKKGSLPARMDIMLYEADRYVEVFQEFQNALENHRAVLAVSGCLRDNEMPGIDTKVEEMLVEGNIDIIKQFWTENYGGLDPNDRQCFQHE